MQFSVGSSWLWSRAWWNMLIIQLRKCQVLGHYRPSNLVPLATTFGGTATSITARGSVRYHEHIGGETVFECRQLQALITGITD